MPPQPLSHPRGTATLAPATTEDPISDELHPARRNVLGGELAACCFAPTTGFYRDGYCRTDAADRGRHVICAQMTAEFLAFTQARGNDLSTPRPEFEFPGLTPGDRWCLCAMRWKEAHENGVAPPVLLDACDENALHVVTLDVLQQYAITATH